MPRYLHRKPSNDPILIGYERLSDIERKLYNHTKVIGYAVKTSNDYWKGTSLTGFVITGHSLDSIGKRMVQEAQCQH